MAYYFGSLAAVYFEIQYIIIYIYITRNFNKQYKYNEQNWFYNFKSK